MAAHAPSARRLRAALVVVAVALLLASVGAPTPDARAAAVGINVAATGGDPFHSPAVARAIATLHPAWVRVFMGWNALEPAPGVYNTAELAAYASFFSHLPAGTRVDVDVLGTPAWASGSASPASPPRRAGDFAAFVNMLANRFRGQVAAWEIWNEEDSAAFWAGTTPGYVALLAGAYPAIKRADPSAEVILGPLVGNDSAYLDTLYADGAQAFFDAVGVHTDPACNVTAPSVFQFDRGTQTIARWSFLGLRSVHTVMAAHGDGGKAIELTELGWSSSTATCDVGAAAGTRPGGVSAQTQAAYLLEAYHCLAQPQYAYVRAADWFELYDNAVGSGWLDNLGLMSTTLAEKPAFAALASEAHSGDRLTGSCGPTAAASPPPHPALAVLEPRPAQRYRGSAALLVAVHASTTAGRLTGVAMYADGRLIVTFRHRGGVVDGRLWWRGARRIGLGRHTLTFIARSRLGATTVTKVTVDHVRR